MIAAIVLAVIVAIAVICVNTAVINSLNAEISSIESASATLRTQLAGLEDQISNVTSMDNVIAFAQKMGMLPIPLKGVKEDCIATGISIYWCINSKSDDKVKEACLVKKDGTLEPLNVKNPSNDKFFKVAYNTYVAGGSEGLEKLNAPEKILYKCDRTETQMFIDYIKSFNNQPITIKEDGRIQKES